MEFPVAEEFQSRVFSNENMQLRLVANEEIRRYQEKIASLKQTKVKLKAQQAKEISDLHGRYEGVVSNLGAAQEKELREEQEEFEKMKKAEQDCFIKERDSVEGLKDRLERVRSEKEERFDLTLKEEFRRYFELKEEIGQLKTDFDREFTDILIAHENKVKEIEQVYTTQMTEVKQEYFKLIQCIKGESETYEEALDHIEKDYEFHLDKMKHEGETEKTKEECHAKEEFEKAEKLKLAKTKLKAEKSAVQTEKNELEKKWKELTAEEEKLRHKLGKTEEQLRDRNEVIHRKDDTIKELRSFNIHLMNFHFVLNQKIETLKEEREPLDVVIQEKEENIRQMYSELVTEFSSNKTVAEKNKTLKDKVKAVEELNTELKKQHFDSSKKLIMIQSDLANLIRTTDVPHLLPRLKELTDKYVKSKPADDLQNFVEIKNSNIRDTLVEANLQKTYNEVMENHATIKDKLSAIERHSKRSQKEKAESLYRKMRENAFLIRECNELRNEKQTLVKDVQLLEKQLHETSANSSLSTDNPLLLNTHARSTTQLKGLPRIGPSDSSGIISILEANKEKILHQTKTLKNLEKRFKNIATG